MKTAEEIHKIFADQNYTVLEIIKLAQSDAYHCGQMDGLEQADKVVRKTIGQVFGTGVESGEEL